MRYAYLGLYTLTDAYRAKELLERRRIHAQAARMPSGSGISCAFGLRLNERDAERARELLAESGLRLGKIVFPRVGGEAAHDLL